MGVSLVKGLPAGEDMTDDRLDTVVGNLRLTGKPRIQNMQVDKHIQEQK